MHSAPLVRNKELHFESAQHETSEPIHRYFFNISHLSICKFVNFCTCTIKHLYACTSVHLYFDMF